MSDGASEGYVELALDRHEGTVDHEHGPLHEAVSAHVLHAELDDARFAALEARIAALEARAEEHEETHEAEPEEPAEEPPAEEAIEHVMEPPAEEPVETVAPAELVPAHRHWALARIGRHE